MIDWLYNMIMNMKKIYVLVEVGGMNSECILGKRYFDNMDEVFDYCNENEICDINGVRFRNSYDEKNWEKEDYILECYDDDVEGKVVRVYGIDEGLELLEIEKNYEN